MVPGEIGFEHIAGERDGPFGAERPFDIDHLKHALEPARLQIGGEVPEFERGIGLALRELFGDQRRRAELGSGILRGIETGTPRERAQHQPAFVDGPTRHADGAALEVGERRNG